MVSGENWLLSGIPRSGSSLCCRLVGDLPGGVALSEPLKLVEFDVLDGPADACRQLSERVLAIRSGILDERRAPSTQLDGEVHDSRVAEDVSVHGLRAPQGEQGEIAIDKVLAEDFLLLVKHNALFAALMPQLTGRFSCLGLVRNPLAVLASWQTVELPINNGHIPAGEKYDSGLRSALEAEPDVLTRQLKILDWFFACYREALPAERIIRYESLVESGGGVLFAALGLEGAEARELSSHNDNRLYAGVDIDRLLEALLADAGAWRSFYSPADCGSLAGQLRATR